MDPKLLYLIALIRNQIAQLAQKAGVPVPHITTAQILDALSGINSKALMHRKYALNPEFHEQIRSEPVSPNTYNGNPANKLLDPSSSLVYADWLEENGHPETANAIRISHWHGHSPEVSDQPGFVPPTHFRAPVSDSGGTVFEGGSAGHPDPLHIRIRITHFSHEPSRSRADVRVLLPHGEMSELIPHTHPDFNRYISTTYFEDEHGNMIPEPQERNYKSGKQAIVLAHYSTKDMQHVANLLMEHPVNLNLSQGFGSPFTDFKGIVNAIKEVASAHKFLKQRKDDQKLALEIAKRYKAAHGVPAQSESADIVPGRGGQEEISWDKYSKAWHRSHGPARWRNAGVRVLYPDPKKRHGFIVIENHRGKEVFRISTADALAQLKQERAKAREAKRAAKKPPVNPD